MFGYVVIDKPNILIKDYQTYRSYYCGICKSIGKRTGQAMRLTLNYDLVLLALLAYNYENKDPVFKKGRCPTHWLKKVEYVQSEGILEKVADVNTVLGYYKLEDDVLDEGKHCVLKGAVGGYYKKAAKRLPVFAEGVKKGYEEIRRKEKNGADVDELGEAFGEILMKAGDAVTDKCDANLRKLLFYVGKWIYGIDAADDLEKDAKNKNFNPFLRDIQYSDDTFDRIEPEMRRYLYDCVDRIKTCYDGMRVVVSEGALSNIMYLGLKARTEFILKQRGKPCRKIRL